MGRDITRVVCAEIQHEGSYLLTQRQAHAVLPNLWEFPGGRVHAGETDEEALQKALSRRIGVQIAVGRRLLHVTHAYENQRFVTLVVYACTIVNGSPEARDVQDLAWVEPEEFDRYPMPPSDAKSLAKLVESLD